MRDFPELWPAEYQHVSLETLLRWYCDPRECPDDRVRVLLQTDASLREALAELRREGRYT